MTKLRIGLSKRGNKGILRAGLARLLQYPQNCGILIDTIEAPLDDLDRAEWYRFLTP